MSCGTKGYRFRQSHGTRAWPARPYASTSIKDCRRRVTVRGHLGQYACWLDPVIVGEWRQLTADWDSTANRHSATKWGAAAADNVIADRNDAAEGGPATDDAFEWTESRYDTSVALERAKQLRDGGFALACVWSASRIRSSPHIDHCFPWARWRNNDLWNLLPARGNINLSKSDRLSAVWMHVPTSARARAFRKLVSVMSPGGSRC